MERRRWIVVGTDFSPSAGRALLRAAALAEELGATIACVHAYEDAPGASLQSDPGEVLTARLEEVASRLRARFPTVALECFVRRGAPWEKLVNVACELGAEMIVVGASGERGRPIPTFVGFVGFVGFAGFASFVGSVVTRVAATSSCAILVVPDRDESTLTPSL